MDADELLTKAWNAVEKSGVPESLYAVAFKEAIDFLRSDSGTKIDLRDVTKEKPPEPVKDVNGNGHGEKTRPNEATFFATLARESGVPETDLRDVLQLTATGDVEVMQPGRSLENSRAEQAQTVIALVAGARAIGLGERPVTADAVRKEVARKNAYDQANFASKHLGPMRGFNAGSNRTQIVLGSRWVEEFTAAVNRALGRQPAAVS